jgi:hypothetical protein
MPLTFQLDKVIAVIAPLEASPNLSPARLLHVLAERFCGSHLSQKQFVKTDGTVKELLRQKWMRRKVES